jgi:uncharacterized protein YjdB
MEINLVFPLVGPKKLFSTFKSKIVRTDHDMNSDIRDNSVKFQLPAGTELGNNKHKITNIIFKILQCSYDTD